MFRSTFSTTTMASSTTMPMASTRPKSDSVLMENPNPSRTANVPTIEIGTATSGMIDARQVWRNSTTTSTTSRIASNSVFTTSRMPSRTLMVGSYTIRYSTPCGKFFFNSSMVLRTVVESCSAFEPGAWKMPMPTASLLLSRERSA